jgi:hypothetical protein
MRIFDLMCRRIRVTGICAGLLLGTAAKGEDKDTSDLILDLFVQKGFVSQQEADQIKAQAEAMRTNQIQMPASQKSNWSVSQAFKKVELFGDVRLRYEDRSASDTANNNVDLQRWRYAVRLGLRGNLFEDFYYGVRLDTSSNPRSTWVAFGDNSTTSKGLYQGPFGKSAASIAVGQAYIGWRPADWFDLTLGKMPNPLYTTPLVWDSDLNPEGAAEHLKYTIGNADLFANFGQFLYAAFNPNSASGGLGINAANPFNADNILQFAYQGGVQYHFATNISAKVAATIYKYLGLRQSIGPNGSALPLAPYFGDPYIGEGAYYLLPGNAPGYSGYGAAFNVPPGYGSVGFPFNQVGLNHLLVLELPAEINFKIWKLNAQLFGDFAYNLEGAKRAEDAANAYQAVAAANPGATPHSFPAQTSDVKAYQVGLELASAGGRGLIAGVAALKHAWEFKAYWQHVEQYSLDPNLIDSDIFEGRENMEGIYAAVAYSISDHLVGSVHYGHASRINPLLGTGGSNTDLPWMNPINDFWLLQVDLTLQF